MFVFITSSHICWHCIEASCWLVGVVKLGTIKWSRIGSLYLLATRAYHHLANEKNQKTGQTHRPVSYTHLTLPTILRV